MNINKPTEQKINGVKKMAHRELFNEVEVTEDGFTDTIYELKIDPSYFIQPHDGRFLAYHTVNGHSRQIGKPHRQFIDASMAIVGDKGPSFL